MMRKVMKIEAGGDRFVSSLKLRVAAYCRVSTDNDDQLLSLEAQKQHYEKIIKDNPEWEFAGLYCDEGISGTKKENREGLLRLLRDCEKHKIDFIITKSISRFARNTADCLEIVRRLSELGVFISRRGYMEEFDGDFYDRFVDGMTVFSPVEIGFRLKCGLVLRERMER